jgi:hypothetical protein
MVQNLALYPTTKHLPLIELVTFIPRFDSFKTGSPQFLIWTDRVLVLDIFVFLLVQRPLRFPFSCPDLFIKLENFTILEALVKLLDQELF